MHTVAFLLTYAVAYFGLVAGIWLFRLNRRTEAAPTPTPLLRAPGEALRRKLERFDDTLLLWMGLGGLGPLAGTLALLTLAAHWQEPWQTWGLITGGALFLVGLVAGGATLTRLLRRRRDYYLGYFGERATAEGLAPLAREGFWLFHNVPLPNGGEIDHVVVGPAGLFAVETKTRRKKQRLARVRWDGRVLQFPWGPEIFGLTQVEDHCDELAAWALRVTGRAVPVAPILVLPGWEVDDAGLGRLRVGAPDTVASLIRTTPRALHPETVVQLADALDRQCRDVEF